MGPGLVEHDAHLRARRERVGLDVGNDPSAEITLCWIPAAVLEDDRRPGADLGVLGREQVVACLDGDGPLRRLVGVARGIDGRPRRGSALARSPNRSSRTNARAARTRRTTPTRARIRARLTRAAPRAWNRATSKSWRTSSWR